MLFEEHESREATAVCASERHCSEGRFINDMANIKFQVGDYGTYFDTTENKIILLNRTIKSAKNIDEAIKNAVNDLTKG